MPITIKSTELKYKNPSTGEYQGVDAVAEMTTSEQCALIEAKGAETRASIPNDYTTVSDTVNSLSTWMTNKILYFPSQPVSSGTGTILTINNSAITTDYVLLECTFAAPQYIKSDLTWTTNAGSFNLIGTAIGATTANITIGLNQNGYN